LATPAQARELLGLRGREDGALPVDPTRSDVMQSQTAGASR